MSPQSSRGKSALFAAALLSSSATAQNTTNSTGSDGCSARPPLGWDHSVNATGQANVTDTQLVVSLLFGEERNQTASNFAPFTYVYLSAPEGSTDQVCVMQFDSIDNRRQGDGPNGCNGVIPQKCVDLLESAITLPVNLLDLMNNSPGSYGCPNLLLDENTLTEACGTSIGGNFLSSGHTINTTNMTCDATPTGITLPDNYNTVSLFGMGAAGGYETQLDNFTMYDEYVTRPVPLIVSSVADGKAQTKVLCIAPDDVREGSRVPADSVNAGNADDDTSAALDMERGRKAGMAALMAGVVAMSFVLA